MFYTRDGRYVVRMQIELDHHHQAYGRPFVRSALLDKRSYSIDVMEDELAAGE